MPKKPREIKEILLGLIKDLAKNCREEALKDKVQKDTFSMGYISGQTVLLYKLEKLIEENI